MILGKVAAAINNYQTRTGLIILNGPGALKNLIVSDKLPISTMVSYDPKFDTLYVFPMSYYENTSLYLQYLLHGVAHATGHPKRLNRFSMRYYRNQLYGAVEENTCNRAAVILCKGFGLMDTPVLDNDVKKAYKHCMGSVGSIEYGAYEAVNNFFGVKQLNGSYTIP